MRPQPSRQRYRRCRPYTVFAGLYDAAMGEAALPALLDAFDVSRKAHGIPTRSIADIGCGTGRFLQYLSRFKGRLYGVDRSPTMLRRAAKRNEDTGIRFLSQDIRELDLPDKVDCITCTFDTINYLHDPGDLQQLFRAVAGNLKPGGFVLLDYIPAGAQGGTRRIVRQKVNVGNIRSTWQTELRPDGTGSKVTLFMRVKRRDGSFDRFSEIHRQTWHAERVVADAVRAAGFDLLDHRPVDGDDKNWLHLVARLNNNQKGQAAKS